MGFMACSKRNTFKCAARVRRTGKCRGGSALRRQLEEYGMISSMSDKGNCYDNAVVQGFFSSLKHEWLTNVIHLTREGMIKDVNDYIRYHIGSRLHSHLGYKIPKGYENSQINVCNSTNLEQF